MDALERSQTRANFAYNAFKKENIPIPMGFTEQDVNLNAPPLFSEIYLVHYLRNMIKISLTLNSYEDIFSVFDTRPYTERSLSVDFLDEAKRASREKSEQGLQLNLLVPKKKRNEYDEILIKERMKDHFRRHYHKNMKEKHESIQSGMKMFLLGILFMITATYVLFKFKEETFVSALVVVILEPAGWFTFWEGLDMMIFESKGHNEEIEFNKKMANAEIKFISY